MIVGARGLCFQIDFNGIGKIDGTNKQLTINSGSNRNPNAQVDSYRHDKAIVVVRVLANQVYPPWCTINAGRLTVEFTKTLS
jgi:hypothetical protein